MNAKTVTLNCNGVKDINLASDFAAEFVSKLAAAKTQADIPLYTREELRREKVKLLKDIIRDYSEMMDYVLDGNDSDAWAFKQHLKHLRKMIKDVRTERARELFLEMDAEEE